MTGSDLHSILTWSSLLDHESCRRVFGRCDEFPALLRRLLTIGEQVVAGGLLGGIVRPGMCRREIVVAILDRYLQVDALTRLPRFALRGLVSAGAGGTCESTNLFSVN